MEQIDKKKFNKYGNEKRYILILNFFLALSGMIIFAVASSLPYWISHKPISTGPLYYQGLYAFCIESLTTTPCGKRTDLSGLTIGVIVCASLALCAYLVSAGAGTIELVWKRADNKKQVIVTAFLAAISSGILTILTIVLFYLDTNDLQPTYFVCFYLACVSILFASVTCGIWAYRISRSNFSIMPKFTKITLTPVQLLPKKEVEPW